MFHDRTDAGEQLARHLARLLNDDVVVVALPRGGVPVAYEVARALDAPLDVVVVRKLGVPFQPELGMGAIAENDVRVINSEIVQRAGVTQEELDAVEARERVELERRANAYRSGRDRIPLGGRMVVVVDDGIATGSTARAACQVAREEGASRVILAVPVAPVGWTRRLADSADELVSLSTPDQFFGVGQFYRHFTQTTDDQVIDYLDRAATAHASKAAEPTDRDTEPRPRDEDITIETGHERLGGHLTIPEHARAIVVFAHGSGSSRHSPRNRYVASVLNEAGLATLLFDLLTTEEEHDRANVFDIDLLGTRLTEVTRQVLREPDLAGMAVGYFGASTGAAAALRAAADQDTSVAAVVSRGGRPDLARPHLDAVRAPTLLIVGERDTDVLRLNREAQTLLRCTSEVAMVPGATHLFEEAGTLQEAAELARDWFLTHLTAAPTTTTAP